MNSTMRMAPSQTRTVRALRDSGDRKAGTPSETASYAGERGAARGEGAKDEEERGGLDAFRRRLRARRLAHLPAEHPAGETIAEHGAEAGDEEIRGSGKQVAGFANPAEVGGGDGGDEEHPQRHPMVEQRGKGRGDGGHAGGHAHRHRQHVVDEEGSARDEPGIGAEIVLGHDAGAAACEDS